MCPDRDLISAYVDGEVPSPWRERLEEHLGACQDCAGVASGYARLGERLKTELVLDEAEALARGRSRLDALLEDLPPARKAWRGTISLPLPMAAAAALLVLLLGGATTLLAMRPSKGAVIQTVASGEIAPPALTAAAQPASMDELLRYLDAQGGQVTLTIKLPSETTFGSAGKPVIMRQAQSLRGPRSGPQNGMPVGGRSP